MAMNKNIISIITLLTLLLCGVNSAFSQEWEMILQSNEISARNYFDEAIELSNGNILASSRLQYINNVGKFSATHPVLTLISSDGQEISRNEYMKPALCEINSPYLFEKNGEMYMLACYNPDHDINSKNYFRNYDNPPSESIIGLYKLDDLLNVIQSYEHTFPIDTFEQKDMIWQTYPSVYSGNIYMYSAFEDDGNIVGSYIKSVSYSNVPRGHDTIFFFKMDFEGNFLLRKGYEMHTTGGEHQTQYNRQQIVKEDNGYVVYYRGYSIHHHGTIEYYDNDFNHITTRYIVSPNHNPNEENNLNKHSVIRSNHNTTYLATLSLDPILESPNDQDRNVRLYELDDNKDNSAEILPVIRYIERGSANYDPDDLPWRLDDLPYCAVDMTSDGDIYFAYTLNYGSMGWDDSWVIIEKLDTNFDTISTFYYDDGVDLHTEAMCIKTIKDDGLLVVTRTKDIIDRDNIWSKVSKFPASAFVNIEEAHAHGLKVAVAYPNPGGDVMNIRTGLRNATLQVYDMQGRKVHEQEVTEEVTSIDASKWSSGTYVWELRAGNGNGRGNENGILESGKWVK